MAGKKGYWCSRHQRWHKKLHPYKSCPIPKNCSCRPKIIKAITLRMEEYGMPKFTDQYPAMDILQLVKDAGYSRGLRRLDEKEILAFLSDKQDYPQIPLSTREKIAKAIASQFAYPKELSVEEILKILIIYEERDKFPVRPVSLKEYAQAIYDDAQRKGK